jgi:G3E family GTPase
MATFVPFGGFLGAGKTTTLLAAARRLSAEGRRVAVVTNDQGGDLVDTRLARAEVPRVSEVTDGCFCCRFDDLATVVTSLLDDGVDVVLAEAVGSCTDLRATVVRPLRRDHGDRLRVAPLTAVVDPDRYRLFARAWDAGAESDLAYLYAHQLAESDVIAVNKIDTVPEDRLPALLADVHRRYPAARVVPFAAASGEVAELLSALAGPVADTGEDPELDYDRYAAAEAALAWLNHAVTLTAPRPGFHPARWATTALATLSSACASAGALIGHAKLSLDTPGGLVKAGLTEAGGAPRLDVTGPGRASGGRAVLNLRIVWTPEALDRAATDAVRAADLACGTHATPEPGIRAFRPAYPRPTHRIPAAP